MRESDDGFHHLGRQPVAHFDTVLADLFGVLDFPFSGLDIRDHRVAGVTGHEIIHLIHELRP